jgi:hypothetical protein
MNMINYNFTLLVDEENNFYIRISSAEDKVPLEHVQISFEYIIDQYINDYDFLNGIKLNSYNNGLYQISCDRKHSRICLCHNSDCDDSNNDNLYLCDKIFEFLTKKQWIYVLNDGIVKMKELYF